MSLKEKEEEAFGIVRDAFAEALGMDAEKVTPKTTVEACGRGDSEVQHVLIQIEEELDFPLGKSLENTDVIRLKLAQTLFLTRIDAQTFAYAVLEAISSSKAT